MSAVVKFWIQIHVHFKCHKLLITFCTGWFTFSSCFNVAHMESVVHCQPVLHYVSSSAVYKPWWVFQPFLQYPYFCSVPLRREKTRLFDTLFCNLNMGSNNIINSIAIATTRTQEITWCCVSLDSLTSECLAWDSTIVLFCDCRFWIFFSLNKVLFELFNLLQVLTVSCVEDKSFFLWRKAFSSALTFQCWSNRIKASTCIKTKV